MLTIGEFAKQGHISKRMLRHYDDLGLLRPVAIGPENGYRYYDPAQLATVQRIEHLKRFGFSLAQVRDLLPLGEEALNQKLHARRLQAYGELHALRKTLRQLEEDIMNMEGSALALDKYQVIVMEAPAQRVFCLRKTINVSETHALFQELLAEMAARGLQRAGVTQQMYMGQEFSYEQMDVEAQVEVIGEAEGVRVLPAGSFAAVTHSGPYEELHYAYEALQAWLKNHPEYEATGNGIERYIKDENSVADPEEFETGVLFPVRRLK